MMKFSLVLLCVMILTYVLWLGAKVSDTVALLVLSGGVGILMVLTNEKRG